MKATSCEYDLCGLCDLCGFFCIAEPGVARERVAVSNLKSQSRAAVRELDRYCPK